ncbi:type VI secretion system protein IglI family protein [Fangia hongkongensis]|uniref:type VI secretion system protein IglI family protein n=1 Tax=Fangia hongkongensis TaxID=270495 RepID=UPI00035EE231|nr:type VI secretion system protein IglI family protein [Fangia hongkongensis]MBK2125032.1 hypothetical protein [Fangia hongkongensis]
MKDLMSYLQELEDIKLKSRVNPMLMSGVVKNFQEGEYQLCQEAIKNYIDQTEALDVYILFIAFSVDLYTTSKKIEALEEKLNLYSAILHQHAGMLSPIDRFDATLKNGIEAFAQMFELKVNEEIKSVGNFDAKALSEVAEKLLAYSANLGGVEIDALKNVINMRKVLKKVEVIVDRMNVEAPEPEEEPKADKESAHDAESIIADVEKKHAWVDQFASAKWYKLVKKIAILQILIKEKRLFEAAIVYKDIQGELVKFDPKQYFPGLFFPLYKTLAPNARKMHEYIDMHSNSLQWHIAKQMYDVDEMRFLKDLPLMTENSYHAEQFTEGSFQDEVHNDDNILLDENANLPDDEEISFNEIEGDEAEPSQSMERQEKVEEIEGILNEIEDIWDSAGLSDSTK